MPIVYLGNTFGATSNGGTSLVAGGPQSTLPPAPQGLRFYIVAVKNNDAISTATAGWTKIIQTNSGAGFTAALFTAELTAGTPTFTWTNAANAYAYGGFFDSVDMDIIVNAASAISSNTGAASPVTATGVTAAVEGGMTMAIAAASDETTVFGPTPAGWTERWDQGSGATNDIRFVMATRNATTVGATGAVSWTKDAVPWVAFQMEFAVVNPPGPRLDVAELEIATPLGSPGNSVREVEIAALLNTGAGNAVLELEICALLTAPPPVLNRRRQTYNN